MPTALTATNNMFVIFGWRQIIDEIGMVYKNMCSHCHNDDYWVLVEITKWFTLFFIPVFPYSTTYFLRCPVCKYGVTLNDEQVATLRPLAEANKMVLNGKITMEEHQAMVSKLNGTPTPVTAEVVEKEIAIAAEANLCYCSNCGDGVTNESKFCGNCGTAVSLK